MPDFSNLCVKIFVFELLFHSKSKMNKFFTEIVALLKYSTYNNSQCLNWRLFFYRSSIVV